MDEEALGERFETASRRSAGIYFTPSWLVEKVLDAVTPQLPPQGPLAIIDPACGAGAFLAAASERFPGATLLGCETIRVNSLHGQGIEVAGQRIVIEGLAEDGTPEAIRIADASGFALGVQWHAEYDPQSNPINRMLFEAFGTALQARKRSARRRA